MKFLLLNIVLIFIGCEFSSSQYLENKFPRVVTPLGRIEGFYDTSSEGKLFESYLGIPYAAPITNKQRFEIAKPVAPWNDVLYAKASGPPCLQIDLFSAIARDDRVVTGSENCLYLNVYTPVTEAQIKRKPPTGLLPVIVYIHGGALQFGSAAEYGPHYLLDGEVIVVTCNYRLGPFGFLSTEDDTVPGNNGLKDQVLAMRWVKENILYFGGNPDSITLVGESAGGASVHYHYLTKLTEGLFNRGISISGTALDPWAQTEGSLEKAKKLATIVGCPSSNVRKMVECLKTRSAEEIARASMKFTTFINTPITPFGPVVESGNSDSTFINQSPIDLMINGKVQDKPWITSTVSEEGLVPAAYFLGNPSLVRELDIDWLRIAPDLLDFNYTIPIRDQNEVSQLIRKHYFGNKPIDYSTVRELISMLGNRWFSYQAGYAAKLQALTTNSAVRFYYFSYEGAHSQSELFLGPNKKYGVMHGDDLAYVMKSFFDATTTSQDRRVQKLMTNLWVSYARDGEPKMGVYWPSLDRKQHDLQYLHIAGPDNIFVGTEGNFGDLEFWRSIPFRENIPTK